MVYTCPWLAFNGSRAMGSTSRVLCNACNVGLHLNAFQPYKGILTYQASIQISLLIPYGGARPNYASMLLYGREVIGPLDVLC